MVQNENTWKVSNRLHSLKDSDNPAVNHIIAGADEIYDDSLEMTQSQYNAQIDTTISELQSQQISLDFDNSPTQNSNNPVTSDGIKTAIDTKASKASNPVQGNLVQHNAQGDLVDSGKSISDLYTKTEGAALQTSITEGLAAKQNVINDIDTIRANAALGATAQQPATTLAGYGISDAYTKTYIDSRIDAQDAAVAQLDGHALVIVDTLPTNASPAETPDPDVIYRLYVEDGQGNVSYEDYMYNANDLTTAIKIATYAIPGIDDAPTAGSHNLVESGGVRGYIDTNIQTLPLLVSKYSINVTTWAYNQIDDYKHLVIPVTGGDKITFYSTLQGIMYYALLASYTTPVLGATPDFVTGYEGRQTILRTETLIIPAGTKYLIINNPHVIGLSELKVNGVSVFDGIWGVLHKFGGNITPEDLSFSLGQFEQVSNKTDEIVRNSNKDKFISQYGANNNIEPIKAGLKGQKLYNLFEIKYRNYVTSEGVVPTEDKPTAVYNTSDYIPVTFGNKYFYVLGGATITSVLAEFDSSKQLISNIVGTGNKQEGIYTPSTNNVAYVVLCSSIPSAPDYCFVDITNRLYAFKEEVPEVDIQTGIVSNNIANPANVRDKTLISSSGRVLTKDEYVNYKVAYIEVSPGDIVTVGGNDDNRTTNYALFDVMPTTSSTAGGATIPIDYGTITQQELINGKTITVPNNCHYLFWPLQYNGSPSSENVKIQANRGNTLLPYDEYQKAIISINGIPIASAVPSDLEERVEQLESDIEDLESDVEDLQGQVLSSLIADLPVSDGTGIQVGYAYIDSTTGVVKIKMS